MREISARMTECAAIEHIEKIRAALDPIWMMIHNASYETGLTGLSLFYFYYALFSGNRIYADRADAFIIKGISALDLPSFKPASTTDSLDAQLSHVGRFIGFVKFHRLSELDIDDYLLELDGALAMLMETKISGRNFDLYTGALAAGYYFLSRPENNQKVNDWLTTLVAGIEEGAEKDDDGDYCWRMPTLFNRVYLGISHGSALIISFLTNVYERGIANESCDRIIRKAVNFLLKMKFGFAKGLFPNYIGEVDKGPKQFALCYGDIGIGYALFRAGTVLKEPKLLVEAEMVLADCLGRKKEDGLTYDASIMYGAAGLAAVFEKLYRISGDRRFWYAANDWYSCISEYAVHGTAFCGYKTKLADGGDLYNINFGYGIIGIGISLMRAIKRDLPPIDPLLLIA
jgi:lantibiotic modifying enzyme